MKRRILPALIFAFFARMAAANQFESLDPIEICGVAATVWRSENSRGKRQFLQVFYDPKTDLVDFSARLGGFAVFSAVFSAENRNSLRDFSECENSCDFSWGFFKIARAENGRFMAAKADGAVTLEFSYENRSDRFFVEFSSDDFSDFCFKISPENLQSLCEDALDEIEAADLE